MKKLILALVVCGFTATGTLLTVSADPALTYGQAVDNLNRNKNTKFFVESFWNKVKGTEVTWAGEVVDVDGGSSKAKISVADKSRPTYKGYNIEVTTSDLEKAGGLRKGQRIRFKGYLDKYDNKDPGVVIELKEAQIF